MTNTVTERIERAKQAIATKNNRGAWGRGVNGYATELLEALVEGIERGYIAESETDNRATLHTALLNGAENWTEYSYGGCAEIYDGDIAERLCNPTELKRTRNGEREPNARETWLDVQARALRQAERIIANAFFTR